jgi:hypothetical protein
MATVTARPVPGSVVNPTFTLNALPTSSTLLVGRRSAKVAVYTGATWSGGIIPNDIMLGCGFKLGTSPAAGIVEWWLAASDDDTNFAGNQGTTDAAQTHTANTKAQLRLIDSVATPATTGFVGISSPRSVLDVLRATVLPKSFSVFLTQNTTVNLDASAGGFLNLTPVNLASA